MAEFTEAYGPTSYAWPRAGRRTHNSGKWEYGGRVNRHRDCSLSALICKRRQIGKRNRFWRDIPRRWKTKQNTCKRERRRVGPPLPKRWGGGRLSRRPRAAPKRIIDFRTNPPTVISR